MKNSIWRTNENCEGSISLTRKKRNSKKPPRMPRKKLETPVAPAVNCKIIKKNCGSGASNKLKTRLVRILEAGEFTRLRMGENHCQIIMKTILQGKETIHYSIYNFVHKFIPMPQAMKFPQQKQHWTRTVQKLEKFSAWNLTKVRSKKEVIDEARAQKFILHH